MELPVFIATPRVTVLVLSAVTPNYLRLEKNMSKCTKEDAVIHRTNFKVRSMTQFLS